MKIIACVFLIACCFCFGCDEGDDATTSGSGGVTECPASDRTGAICKDGSTSTSTGAGTCSGHGGVNKWLCD